MAKTRIHLKHLLENLRDDYPFPIEEAMLTELVANSLDSACSQIEIKVEPEQRRLTFVDNGGGMTPKAFERYHDIASTGKIRGKGIGFAGVGAKLALLVCREVLTETKRKRSCSSSRWRLVSEFDARWDPMGPLGIVPDETGTGVRLHFRDGAVNDLLSDDYVKAAIQKHYYPLLDTEFTRVLEHLYPQGVAITVNDEPVVLPEMKREAGEYFFVRRGKRKKLTGVGFLLKAAEELPEEQRGLAISTYGKVIKRGWDWLGMTPKHPAHLTGVIEVPELVECLTTNKSEFLKAGNALNKFYRCRKEIQGALVQTLEAFGEVRHQEPKADKSLKRLQKEIDQVLGDILPDFPELAPLFGRKGRGAQVASLLNDPDGTVDAEQATGTDVATGDKGGAGQGEGLEGVVAGPLDGTHLQPSDKPKESAKEHTSRRKRPGLMLGFDYETGGDDLAWLRGETLDINGLHPAWKRVQNSAAANLYITFAVASELSANVQEDRPPLEFLQRFMAAWGNTE